MNNDTEEVEEQEDRSEEDEVAVSTSAKTRSPRSKSVAEVKEVVDEEEESEAVPEMSVPAPPPAWGRVTNRAVVAPPPPPAAIPNPSVGLKPVVVQETTKPEPEVEETEGRIGQTAASGPRPPGPVIIGVPTGGTGLPGPPGQTTRKSERR